MLPQVLQRLPQVLEMRPQVLQLLPKVLELLPQILQRLPQVLEMLPQILQWLSQVFEMLPQVLQWLPQLLMNRETFGAVNFPVIFNILIYCGLVRRCSATSLLSNTARFAEKCTVPNKREQA